MRNEWLGFGNGSGLRIFLNSLKTLPVFDHQLPHSGGESDGVLVATHTEDKRYELNIRRSSW